MLECKTEKRKASANTKSQWSKQEACFTRATQVLLAVNYNTSVTPGEWSRCSKRFALASELESCYSNFVSFMRLWTGSWGYERLQNFKDSLKAWFENVNIINELRYCLVFIRIVSSLIKRNSVFWNRNEVPCLHRLTSTHLKLKVVCTIHTVDS